MYSMLWFKMLTVCSVSCIWRFSHVPLYDGLMQHDIEYSMVMTEIGYRSYFEFTKNTSSLARIDELFEVSYEYFGLSLWPHQMETFSALLALGVGNPPVISGFPSQRASNTDLWCSFAVSLNKLLNKQSIDQRFQTTPWRSFGVDVMWKKYYIVLVFHGLCY